MCEACSGRHTHGFPSGNRALFVYDDIVQRVIHNFKYLNHPEFAEGLIAAAGDSSLSIDADIITWVPLHRNRLNARGFNQAEALAEQLSKATGVPCAETLVRVADTQPQSSLSIHARADNLRGAFKARRGADVAAKRVIITDDIYTTGATLEACAQILAELGAADVRGFTAAVAIRDLLN